MPSWVRPCAPSTRWKRSKTRGSSSSGMPMPVSLHGQRRRARPRVATRHGDAALKRELEGVRQQVEDDLLPHVAIDVDRLGQRRGSRRRSRARPRSIAERNALASSVGQAREIDRLEAACTRPASIREKSSSVFTSFSSRSPLRCDRARAASRCVGGTACSASTSVPRAGRASASAACGTRG